MARHIFLSYSREDKHIVDRLHQDLAAAGFHIWIDQAGLTVGEPDWQDAIEDAIKEATCVVVVLSPDALQSDWVARELDLSLNPPADWHCCPLRIFPVVVRGDPKAVIPPSLAHTQWLDARHDYDGAAEQLIQSLRDYSGITKPTAVLPRIPWRAIAAVMAAVALVLLVLLAITALGDDDTGGSSAPGATPPPFPDVSLLSLRYMALDYNPHLVDLRTAASDGIMAPSGYSLKFQDLWIWASQEAPEYGVQAEVYANGEDGQTFVGASAGQTISAGANLLGDVTPKQFIHGSVENAWLVQDDWTDLIVVLVTYHQGDVVDREHIKIHLNPNSTAWLLDTPTASFASLVYAINDGPLMVLDLPTAEQSGINTRPGDTLTLYDVWYHADTDSLKTMTVEAYLTAGGYNPDTLQISPAIKVEHGIHPIQGFEPMNWTVEDSFVSWVISLGRDDQTLLDRIVVPLGSDASPGLVRSDEALLWPFEQAIYTDFETPDALDEWRSTDVSTLARTSEHAFTGAYSLAVTTTSGANEDALKATWDHHFRAETVVGQVYWPSQPDTRLVWAQACAWACVSIELNPDQWNTFVMDFSELTHEGEPLNTIDVYQVWIQVQIDGVNQDNPYTFYMDGVQLYPTTTQP
ncbi:MAG: toll/interleukin-1 receptor domain-containing protein [Anaerolineae bacterium]|nr:toll/interleukin-1 receptor domain-containing protein [Anaerolineae bacterium]